jgi:capsular polysaccharide transport system permease protein
MPVNRNIDDTEPPSRRNLNRWSRLLGAFATQGRVVHAIMLREIKSRFGRQKLGYLWAVLEPAAFVSLFALLFAYGRQTAPSGMPVVPFMITGFAPFILFRSTMTQTLGAIETNRILLTFPQVTPFDLVFARALLELATLTVVFFLLVAAAHGLGFDVKIEDPLAVLFALGCLAMTGAGVGAFCAALAPFVRSLPMIVSLVAGRPLFFVSGLFFTAEMLPGSVRDILLMNPLLHMIEWLRSAFFVEFESRYASLEYALGTALFALFFGLLMLRGLRKRILAAV